MAEPKADSRLPAAARRLLVATTICAVALAATALFVEGTPELLAVVLLTLGIVIGELLKISLPQRGGGTAWFGLGDAALTAGLLVLGPGEVAIGATAGVMLLQAVERVSPVKFAMNVAQYTAGAASAALAVHLLAPRPGEVDPAAVLAVGVGVVLFLAVNALTVGGMIALTSGRSLWTVLQALVPTGTLLAFGNMALAVIAVVLAETTPWVLPGLAVPLALLWYASRQAVRAQVDRERSTSFAELEHALGAAVTADEVVRLLAGGITTVLGCRGMVWREGRWATSVPEGSGRCPVDASLTQPLRAPAATLGVAAHDQAGDGQAVAIGLGDGVLVVTRGELPLDNDALEWVDRLARSGRVHVARAAAAAALQQERATLGAVVDGTGDGVLLLRPDGSIAVWNPAMARLSGVSAADAVDGHVDEVLGEGPWQSDGVHDVLRPGADAVWRVAVSGIEDAALADTGRMWVLAVHDVTAERRAARARDDMLGIVSHELRTPLTPIIASAQMLRRRSDRLGPEQRDALLAQIQDRAQHLTRLVDDLLLVGQLSAGGGVVARLSSVPIRVGDLVTDAVTATELARPDHRLSLRVGEDCVATTDPVRLRQVLDNLLDNACKFSTPGSLIEVEVAAEGGPDGDIVIRVADHGRGIPPADLERVFEQFARVEDPLVMTTSGAGLGLFIVRQLVHALRGTIGLRSTVGTGTTVTVRLPRLDHLLPADQPADQPADAPPAADVPSTR